jgi:hypothetical protein
VKAIRDPVGSKSAFTLVDSFHVESYFNGTKYSALWYLENQATPVLIITHEEETKEPNGLKYIIPCKETNNLESFQQACITQLFNFDILPEFYSDIDDLTTKYDLPEFPKLSKTLSDTLKVYSTPNGRYYNNKMYISVGGVVYPYTRQSRLFSEFTDTFCIPDSSNYFVLEVPIGSVTIPMNREGIENTDKNEDTIASVFNQSYSDVLKTIYKETNKIKLDGSVSLREIIKDIGTDKQIDKSQLHWLSNIVKLPALYSDVYKYLKSLIDEEISSFRNSSFRSLDDSCKLTSLSAIRWQDSIFLSYFNLDDSLVSKYVSTILLLDENEKYSPARVLQTYGSVTDLHIIRNITADEQTHLVSAFKVLGRTIEFVKYNSLPKLKRKVSSVTKSSTTSPSASFIPGVRTLHTYGYYSDGNLISVQRDSADKVLPLTVNNYFSNYKNIFILSGAKEYWSASLKNTNLTSSILIIPSEAKLQKVTESLVGSNVTIVSSSDELQSKLKDLLLQEFPVVKDESYYYTLFIKACRSTNQHSNLDGLGYYNRFAAIRSALNHFYKVLPTSLIISEEADLFIRQDVDKFFNCVETSNFTSLSDIQDQYVITELLTVTPAWYSSFDTLIIDSKYYLEKFSLYEYYSPSLLSTILNILNIKN